MINRSPPEPGMSYQFMFFSFFSRQEALYMPVETSQSVMFFFFLSLCSLGSGQRFPCLFWVPGLSLRLSTGVSSRAAGRVAEKVKITRTSMVGGSVVCVSSFRWNDVILLMIDRHMLISCDFPRIWTCIVE